MIIGNDFVYVALQKTASSHVRRVLRQAFGDQIKVRPKHAPLRDVPQHDRRRALIGTVRNPWDWYVSIWAYGCQRHGELYNKLVRPRRWTSAKMLQHVAHGLAFNRRGHLPARLLWAPLYADASDPRCFQRWLKAIFDNRKVNLSHRFGLSPASAIIGLLSYRYLHLYTPGGRRAFQMLDSRQALQAYLTNNDALDWVIRTEQLVTDIEHVLRALDVDANRINRLRARFHHRTNASLRRRDFRSYYDEDSYRRVADREALIIERYGYTFDG